MSFLSYNISSTFLRLALRCGRSHSELSESTSFSTWHLEISFSFESSLLSFSFERSLAPAISSIELETTGENESESPFDYGFKEPIIFCILVTAGQPSHKSLQQSKKVKTAKPPTPFSPQSRGFLNQDCMLLSFAAIHSLFIFSLFRYFFILPGYSFLKISKISSYFWRFISQSSALNSHFSLSAGCNKSCNSPSVQENSTSFFDFFSFRGYIADIFLLTFFCKWILK